jgi:hypothetical protein
VVWRAQRGRLSPPGVPSLVERVAAVVLAAFASGQLAVVAAAARD